MVLAYSLCIFCILAKFLFIESSSPRVVGDTAHLVSTVFNRTAGNGRCFTFWYHMYGTDIGRLNIYVNTTSGGKQLKWRLIGNQGNSWFNGQVNVGIASGPYSVSILVLLFVEFKLHRRIFTETELPVLSK